MSGWVTQIPPSTASPMRPIGWISRNSWLVTWPDAALPLVGSQSPAVGQILTRLLQLSPSTSYLPPDIRPKWQKWKRENSDMGTPAESRLWKRPLERDGLPSRRHVSPGEKEVGAIQTGRSSVKAKAGFPEKKSKEIPRRQVLPKWLQPFTKFALPFVSRGLWHEPVLALGIVHDQ